MNNCINGFNNNNCFEPLNGNNCFGPLTEARANTCPEARFDELAGCGCNGNCGCGCGGCGRGNSIQRDLNMIREGIREERSGLSEVNIGHICAGEKLMAEGIHDVECGLQRLTEDLRTMNMCGNNSRELVNEGICEIRLGLKLEKEGLREIHCGQLNEGRRDCVEGIRHEEYGLMEISRGLRSTIC